MAPLTISQTAKKRNLLDLPPEILLQTLSLLPLTSLLSFSLTNRYSHKLASSSLTTLALGIFPTKLCAILSRLESSYTDLSSLRSSTSRPASSDSINTDEHSDRGGDGYGPNGIPEDRRAAIILPAEGPEPLDTATLIAFHDALISSVLLRYSRSLRVLELQIWHMSPAIARALASCKGLKSLTLKIENPFTRRRRPRAQLPPTSPGPSGMERKTPKEDPRVWDIFDNCFARLEVLRLEGASGMRTAQFEGMVRRCRWLAELWLRDCEKIDGEVWRFLGGSWCGRENLRLLGFDGCRALREEDLRFVKGLSGLEALSLCGCVGLTNRAIERMNVEDWHIPDVVLPHSMDSSEVGEMIPAVIEVDPAYVNGEEVVF